MAKEIVEEVVEEIEVVEEETGSNPFVSTVHRVLMAGVGAVALAQEEVEDFVSKLVDRGELAEKDGRKLITDLSDKRKDAQTRVQETAQSRVQETADAADRRMEKLLSRMNVPTKSDIAELSEKIALLSEKVDALRAQS